MFMRQNSAKRPFIFTLLFLVAFLCCLPAVSHAVQSSGSLPSATDSCEVPAGTDAARLRTIFQLSKDLKLTVYQADGSVRSTGCVVTGDRAVIRDSAGELVDCILIAVEGQPAVSAVSSAVSSEAPPDVSQAVSSVSSTPVSEVSGPEVSSSSAQPVSSEPTQPVSSEASQPVSSGTPSSAPEPAAKQELILKESIEASCAVRLLSGEASRVTVFAPDGSARKDGLICTGDRFVLQDERGNVFRTMTVTVLGDLTRCGRPTESACSLLYGYLTGNTSLPADLSAAADINRDQRVDTADLLRIKLKLLENSSAPGE